jgi:hypothetical protein
LLPFARPVAKTLVFARIAEPLPLEVLDVTLRVFEYAEAHLAGNIVSAEIAPVLHGLATVASVISPMALSKQRIRRHWCAAVVLCERVSSGVQRILDSTMVERFRRCRCAIIDDRARRCLLLPEGGSRTCRRAVTHFRRILLAR